MEMKKVEARGEVCALDINIRIGSGENISTGNQILKACRSCANRSRKDSIVEICLNEFGYTLK